MNVPKFMTPDQMTQVTLIHLTLYEKYVRLLRWLETQS